MCAFFSFFPFSHAYNVDGFLLVNHFFSMLMQSFFRKHFPFHWLCVYILPVCSVLCDTVAVSDADAADDVVSYPCKMCSARVFAPFVSNTLTHSTIYI